VSDVAIDYPKIKRLDCLVVMNLNAYSRYMGDVREGGVVIYDSGLFDISKKVEGISYIRVEASNIAQRIGSPQAANVVMLGSLSGTIDLYKMDAIKLVVVDRFPKASAINLKALEAGSEATK
jgi:Pyruvate/2-oxoacid:ferredoxin oxidoreductase gamma subunit